jgi:hypothetical protein
MLLLFIFPQLVLSSQIAGQLHLPKMSARALLKNKHFKHFKHIDRLPTRRFSTTRPANADFTHAVRAPNISSTTILN